MPSEYSIAEQSNYTFLFFFFLVFPLATINSLQLLSSPQNSSVLVFSSLLSVYDLNHHLLRKQKQNMPGGFGRLSGARVV